MEISRAEKIFEHPPVKDQQLEKAVKEIKEKEKTVQPADANDRPDEDGKGGRINIKV